MPLVTSSRGDFRQCNVLAAIVCREYRIFRIGSAQINGSDDVQSAGLDEVRRTARDRTTEPSLKRSLKDGRHHLANRPSRAACYDGDNRRIEQESRLATL